MYYWRMSAQCPPEYRQKSAASQAALIKETEFAFKQAFAFCPYSPEAVYRYVNFLLQMASTEVSMGHDDRAGHYFDDAILVGETCQKLDPFNTQITDLINTVKSDKASLLQAQVPAPVNAMQSMAQTNPGNIQNLMMLAGAYLQAHQTNQVVELFNTALSQSEITFQQAAAIAQFFDQIGNLAGLESAIKKLVALSPDQPEPRYDLAALQAFTGDQVEALKNLKTALDMSAQRLAKTPSARDLKAAARSDNRFDRLRTLPEFQKLIQPN
jgi:tetratricopeptide (TPR) repeat protein